MRRGRGRSTFAWPNSSVKCQRRATYHIRGGGVLLTSGNCSQLYPELMMTSQVPCPCARSSYVYTPGFGLVSSLVESTRLRCKLCEASSVFIMQWGFSVWTSESRMDTCNVGIPSDECKWETKERLRIFSRGFVPCLGRLAQAAPRALLAATSNLARATPSSGRTEVGIHVCMIPAWTR